MTSLKDVAALAGVSPSTVSRVINGTMYVTDETRQRVEEAIAAVNYRPNLLAQSLRLKATRQHRSLGSRDRPSLLQPRDQVY